MAPSRFVLSGFMPPEGEDPLGIWALRAERVTAFGAGEDTDGTLVWHTELPAMPDEARPVLGSRLARLQVRQQQLMTVEQRLTALDPLSPDREIVGANEARLLSEISALRFAAVAYEAAPEGGPSIKQLYEECRALLSQFRRLVRECARVETQVGGRDVALTAVDWTGGYQTAWLEGLTAADMELHVEAVRLALASRRTLLRLVTIVISGAVDLGLKVAVPGGQFLLVPAVYRYVRDVLAELDRLRGSQPVN